MEQKLSRAVTPPPVPVDPVPVAPISHAEPGARAVEAPGAIGAVEVAVGVGAGHLAKFWLEHDPA
jgi:hypothetical protein